MGIDRRAPLWPLAAAPVIVFTYVAARGPRVETEQPARRFPLDLASLFHLIDRRCAGRDSRTVDDSPRTPISRIEPRLGRGGGKHAFQADQALALLRGGLGLPIVDQFAAAGEDCVVRPLAENLDMTSTFVYAKFSPPTRNATLPMRAVYRRAGQLARRTGSVPGDVA